MVRSILLVDDQSFVGMALTRLLAAETDLQIHTCLEADTAVARANELRPNLILQDLVMPKVDGLTLVKLFRGNPATAKTPILVLSANDDEDTRQQALASGADDYLVKLPPAAELVACLRRHLAGGAAPPSAGQSARLNAPIQTGNGLAAALIGRFVQEMNTQFAALEQASSREDIPATKEIAHRLRGCAGTVGARPLAAACRQLEENVDRPGSHESRRALVMAVAEEVNRVRQTCVRVPERVE